MGALAHVTKQQQQQQQQQQQWQQELMQLQWTKCASSDVQSVSVTVLLVVVDLVSQCYW
jgi:DNA-binding protein YbaB